MSPNAGGEVVGCWVSANENSYAHHVTWSPNKLWISNSIFNLCCGPNLSSSLPYSEAGLLQSCKMITFKPALWLRIRIRRIRTFLGLQDFDPDPDPSLFVRSIIKQKKKKKTYFFFVDIFKATHKKDLDS